MVNHEVLLITLRKYGIMCSLYDWFHSYLSGQRPRVKINVSISREFRVTSGVPQGSHLGPLLFCIFVNDIGVEFTSRYSLFADDSKVYRSIKNIGDRYALQEDINKLVRWCAINRLKLNVGKCAIVKYSRHAEVNQHQYYIGNDIVGQVETIKDLGVHIDSKLTFVGHINNIVAKANKILGSLLRTSDDFVNDYTLVNLFNALVRPILEYGCIVWDPIYSYQIDKLESVQKKVIKGLRYRNSNRRGVVGGSQTYEFDNTTLASRRKYLTFCMGAGILNGHWDVQELRDLFDFVERKVNLRKPRVIDVPLARLRYNTRAPTYRMAKVINEYAEYTDIFDMTVEKIKSEGKRLILQADTLGNN